GAIEWNFLRHHDRLLVGYDAVFTEGANEHQLLEVATVSQRTAAIAVERHGLRSLAEIFLAQDRRVAVAIEAMTAMRVPRQHDVVADLDPARGRPHLLDD